MKPRSAKGESGFALLLVFALAAIVAISLYMELPRVAFEAQRSREQLLIDRGEQYRRAIQLYVRKFSNTYPPTLEALENTNNMRFLRRRYKDPLTGQDQWRIIHAGPGGVLTDSLTQKPPQAAKDKDKDQSSSSGLSSSDQQQQQPPQPSGIAFRRRPSDGGPQPGFQPGQQETPPAAETGPGQPGAEANPQPLAPGAVPLTPGQPQPPQPQYPTGFQPQPGQPVVIQPGQYPPGFQPQPGQPVVIQPGQYPPGFQPQPGQPVVQPGQYAPGFQPQPGQPVVIQPGQYPAGFPQPGQPGQPGQPVIYPGFQPQSGQQPSPYPQTGQPGYPGAFPTGGYQPPQPYNPQQPGQPFYRPQSGASGPGTTPVPTIIMQQLTSPRPGGFPGAGPAGATIGGGIAGVASNAEGEGIKVYNERFKYKEWEFIYDPRKDMSSAMGQMMNPALGNQGQQPQPAKPGQTPNPGSLFTPTRP